MSLLKPRIFPKLLQFIYEFANVIARYSMQKAFAGLHIKYNDTPFHFKSAPVRTIDLSLQTGWTWGYRPRKGLMHKICLGKGKRMEIFDNRSSIGYPYEDEARRFGNKIKLQGVARSVQQSIL
ncbi:hypothetical protein HDU88_001586 [Geranomyces variabilis]|nr:hypothetical protein HDU88_001586 [Geranomyces variabilis]